MGALIPIVIKLKVGFTLDDVTNECFLVFGNGHPDTQNVHEHLPDLNSGIDPWAEGGYLTCKTTRECAENLQERIATEQPVSCDIVRIEFPENGPYEPVQFLNSEGQMQNICAIA